MPYTLKLDALSHDLKIGNGRLLRIAGSDEVRQRVKVALWHELGEYFIYVNHGIPWHSEILGGKLDNNSVLNIVRNAILDVPGVRKIISLSMSRSGRNYSISAQIEVERGKNEIGDGIISINGIIAGG